MTQVIASQIPATSTRTGRGRAATAGLWTLQVLGAALFAFSAVPKLMLAEATTESAAVLGVGSWFFVVIGLLELAGAIALLVPILSGLAASCFIALMVGALATQVIFFDGFAWYMPLVGLALVAPVAWARRDQTGRLFRILRRR
ncbi:DoxX family protein [Phytomonospora sp. NPDC050363]|uniref:DoxX family protein n=1 Tax=Phytomonospora sp. NPDC050363 TaxID=3155642 RepID=UPI0033C2DA33